MSVTTFDPVEYKNGQRQAFDVAAKGWAKWWKIFEEGGKAVSDRLVERAGIRHGHRVLDVATGIGEPAVTAAHRVGPDGHVLGIDISSKMIEIARERSSALGLKNIEFQDRDAEALNGTLGKFDAVTCRWGLMFLPDLERSLEHIYQLLSPTGRFAASVWAGPERVPYALVTLGVIQKLVQPPQPAPGTPSLFRLSNPEVLERSLSKAGFEDLAIESMPVTFRWPSAEDFVNMVKDTTPPVTSLLAHQPDELQRTVWDAIKKEAQKFAADTGEICMQNETIIVIGRR